MQSQRTTGLRRAAQHVLDISAAREPAASLLAAFAPTELAQRWGLPLLAGSSHAECWHSPDAGAFRIEQLQIADSGDIGASAAQAYRQLLQRVRRSAQPYLLRIWNYFDGINEGEGDAERYRAFCVGRAAAVDDQFHAPPPAATAIGSLGHGHGLQVIALCGAEPGIALENPRQTPAWRYPREYGPVAPGFSRGVVLGQDHNAVLLASGTASIVGHVSLHGGDVGAQLDESLRNLAALLAEGEARSRSRFALADCRALRIYLRHAGDLAAAQAVLADSPIEPLRVRWLQGEICRRELDVELEGVFVAH